jgi:hypothetical protein
VVRLAARDPEALEGALPALSSLHRVTAAGQLDESARVHFILHRLIPEYLERLPGGRDCMAIRELMTWEEEDGESRSLTTRYHKASGHLISPAHDFGRRQEPRLLLECARRFITLDHEDRLQAEHAATVPTAPTPLVTTLDEALEDLSPSAPVEAELTAHRVGQTEETPPPSLAAEGLSTGIAGVHRNLDYHLFADLTAAAKTIRILNTWIPELNLLADALLEALTRGTDVRILMLFPDSRVARLRNEALLGTKQAPFREDQVRLGVRHCLDVLGAIASMVDTKHRRYLRVRLYHSLPSIAVYGVDERAFVSPFLHGRLAVNTPQIEVLGQESLLGRSVFGEVETLWEIGQEFGDATQWRIELAGMAHKFRIPPGDGQHESRQD